MADWQEGLWILCLTYLIPKVQHKIVFSTLNKTLKHCPPVLSSLLSFSRCFAALGDVSTVRFLHKTNQIADKVSQETVWVTSGQVQDTADTCAGLKMALIFSDIWSKKVQDWSTGWSKCHQQFISAEYESLLYSLQEENLKFLFVLPAGGILERLSFFKNMFLCL